MPGLGAKYDIEIVTIEKPIDEYMTDEYFELDLHQKKEAEEKAAANAK